MEALARSTRRGGWPTLRDMWFHREDGFSADRHGDGLEPAGRSGAPVSRFDPWLGLLDLPAPPATRRIIEREQALHRRGRPPFSVVVVAVGQPIVDPGPALRLLRVFRLRSRIGDEVGWIAPDRLAFVLPLTPERGARSFAEMLCGHPALEHDAFSFEVLTP
jgi:hypothetical protein